MIPQAAVLLILNAEGIDQPWEWPGGDSGISLGVGYDLSAETGPELVRDWTPYLGTVDVARLATVVGLSGADAEAAASRFRDIQIVQSDAEAVFASATLPKYEAQTALAFPGIAALPDLARGALVSLVFNRGPGMVGDRRCEMRQIRDDIQALAAQSPASPGYPANLAWTLEDIASQLRSMKRLWEGQGLDGLLARREAEARLVLSALGPAPATDAVVEVSQSPRSGTA